MKTSTFRTAAVAALFTVTPSIAQQCKRVKTVEDFSLEQYVSKPWYVQQQAVTEYSPLDQNYCARAKYTIRGDGTTILGYTVRVENSAKNADGDEFGGRLCAFQEGDSAKLYVAPCFLPKFAAGPYFIVAYDEDEGYALISGGQPTIPTKDGLCKSGDGVNNAGLWIFTRAAERDEDLVNKVRGMAEEKGFDLSVLNDVNQEGCYDDVDQCSDAEGRFPARYFGRTDCDTVRRWKWLACKHYEDECPETCDICD